MRFVRAAVMLSLGICGCSLLLDDGYSNGSPSVPNPDGGDDGGPVAPDVASAAGVDGGEDSGRPLGPNLIANGDFALGCAGWEGYNATLEESAEGRTGKSCKVCTTASYGSIFQYFDSKTAENDSFYGEFWVHAAPGAPVMTKAPAIIVINEYDNGGSDPYTETPGPLPNETWTRVSGVLVVRKAGAGITLELGAANGDGKCWLVDDGALRRFL